MAGERKQIRDSVGQILSTGLGLPVFMDRAVDGRLDQDFISVYFQSGNTEFQGLRGVTSSELIVSFNATNIKSDDEIDVVADVIDELMLSGDVAKSVVSGISQAGWEYTNDSERSISGISLRYSVNYIVN